MTEAQSIDFGMFNPTDEVDIAGAGFNVPERAWTITEVTVEQGSNVRGAGVQAKIEYTAEGDSGKPVSVTDTYWLKHQDGEMDNIGRGQIKRVLLAAGITAPARPNLGQLAALVQQLQGTTVLATGSESADGFRRIGRFKKAAVGQTAAGDNGAVSVTV